MGTHRFDPRTLAPFRPASLASPGAKTIAAWAAHVAGADVSAHAPIHGSDLIRMLALHEYGGSYIDFDHIVRRPMTELKNALGSEVCAGDNPNCLAGAALARAFGWAKEFGARAELGLGRMSFEAGIRYTPCNGVAANFEPRHPFLARLLRRADRNGYDPSCWGCFGPQLMGQELAAMATHVWKGQPLEAKLASAPGFVVLPPGFFYPYDYRQAVAAAMERLPETEALVAKHRPYGVHRYSGGGVG